jgi:KUP system potassium uptake protein
MAPAALLHNLKHNKVLHEHNLFVNVQHHEQPWIGLDRRVEVQPLGHDCWQVTLHYGFKNDPDVPRALRAAHIPGLAWDEMQTSYFLSRNVVVPAGRGAEALPRWQAQLFAALHRNAAGTAEFLLLPPNRTVELGARTDL